MGCFSLFNGRVLIKSSGIHFGTGRHMDELSEYRIFMAMRVCALSDTEIIESLTKDSIVLVAMLYDLRPYYDWCQNIDRHLSSPRYRRQDS